jgi:DNA-binding response OmpR family regulator
MADMSNSTTRFPYARILVVDDSVFERMLITTALKKAGFSQIVTADDGSDALQKTYDYQPDIVLLDLNMPNLDGFGYCEKVRADARLPRMPIIVQTALEDRESRLQALASGCDDFLIKPLDMAELSLRICVHVERYFMLRDTQNMCTYLQMELETVKNLRESFVQPGSNVVHLENHLEVLEQLAHLTRG